MTERMVSGWMTVWRLDTGEQRDSKDAAKMVEANGTTWGDITEKAKKCKIEALKEAYDELKEMYGEAE